MSGIPGNDSSRNAFSTYSLMQQNKLVESSSRNSKTSQGERPVRRKIAKTIATTSSDNQAVIEHAIHSKSNLDIMNIADVILENHEEDKFTQQRNDNIVD